MDLYSLLIICGAFVALALTLADTSAPPADPLDDVEFQKRVLGGVDGLKSKIGDLDAKVVKHQTQQEKLLSDYDRLDKETKKAFEELTAVKNNANDSAQTLTKLTKVLQRIEFEKRANFTSPVKRFCASEDNRNWANAIFRKLAFPDAKLPDHLTKALTGADSSLGQATVPQETFNEIYSLLSEFGVWNTFQVLRVGARTNTIPMATARPTYYWLGSGTGGTAEGAQITEGSITGTSVTLSIQTLAALLGVARELLQDSEADISEYVMSELGQSIAYGLDFATLAADGTADQTDAGYVGVFEAASANTNLKAEAAAGNITVQGTDLEDWERVLTTVNAKVITRAARWWMHPFILSKAMLVRDNQGRPIFQTALEAPSPGAIGRILGYPVTLGDACPSTNAAAAKVAVFGDPMGQGVAIRSDLELALSEHWRFDYNQIGYRALLRAGVKVKTATASSVLKPFAVLTLPAA